MTLGAESKKDAKDFPLSRFEHFDAVSTVVQNANTGRCGPRVKATTVSEKNVSLIFSSKAGRD